MNRVMKRMLCSGLAVLLFAASCNPTNSSNTGESLCESGANKDAWEEARTTPLGKYPETITFTQAKMKGNNKDNLPEGDTYEDNVYSRCMEEMLNIKCENILLYTENQYIVNQEMMIANDSIPDIMVVSDLETLRYLVEKDMIADLTQAYEDCASDRIKDIYNSYDSIFQTVTFDGKLMAVPETNIATGPNLIWLRKDWMDKLGLEEPKTIDDIEYIVKQFIEKDPGNNGAGKTIGLVCDTNVCGESGYGNEYQMDLVFATYGAFPKQWIELEDGTIGYGSVQPEMKDALARLNRWYAEGIIEQEFLFHTSTNIMEALANGTCGSFFAPWWATNNPLMDTMKESPDAEWVPYLISTDEDGSVSYYSQNPTFQYVVVSRDFPYPEIAFKIVSLIFDYMRYDERNNPEYAVYYAGNVDPNVRPLAINVDYNNAVEKCYNNIISTLNGELNPDDLMVVERGYYDSCKAYIDLKNEENEENDSEEGTSENQDWSLWSAWLSRIYLGNIFAEAKENPIDSLFFGETDTMQEKWDTLQDMEKEMYLKIITGEEPVDYFDTFVEEWKNLGGNKITKEVNTILETEERKIK